MRYRKYYSGLGCHSILADGSIKAIVSAPHRKATGFDDTIQNEHVYIERIREHCELFLSCHFA